MRVMPGLRLLHVLEDGTQFAARGSVVLSRTPTEASFAQLTDVSKVSGADRLSNLPLLSRILRLGCHAIERMSDGSLLLLVRRKILRLSADGSHLSVSLHIDRGSRPLRLCSTPQGNVYFGVGSPGTELEFAL